MSDNLTQDHVTTETEAGAPTQPTRSPSRRTAQVSEPSEADDRRRRDAGRRRRRRTGGTPAPSNRRSQLEREGEVAADFLETLLDICDLDGDIDVDIDGDRAAVSVVDSEDGRVPRRLVGQNGQVLEALQELTRLAVQSATGERSRLMLDVAGHRAERRAALVTLAKEAIDEVRSTGERKPLTPDDRLRAQGRARRGARRRSGLGVRGRRAAPVRRHPSGVRRRFT